METLLELFTKFTKEIELNPDDANSYYNRAIIRNRQGDIKGAIVDFTMAIKFNPSCFFNFRTH